MLTELERMTLALKVYDQFNRISNDLSAYQLAMSEWARGERKEQPKRSDFGLEHYNIDDTIAKGEIK
jgi:hypothetical protein